MKIIFLVGPTAIGKTELALKFCKDFNYSLISADSIQIYKFLNLGTGKPSYDEVQGVELFLYDHIHPNSYYSAYNFFIEVKEVIRNNSNKNFIIVGGAGLFIEALIRGIAENLPRDEHLRKQIHEEANEKSWAHMHNLLKEIDPEYANKISPNDPIRITRALEIYFLTGKTMSSIKDETKKSIFIKDYVLINLTCDRKILYERINYRVEKWFKKGWIQEVQDLYEKKIINDDFKALGFQEIISYLKNETTNLPQLIEKVKKSERNYAKRQITWFKRYKERIDLERTFDFDNDYKNFLHILKEKGVI